LGDFDIAMADEFRSQRAEGGPVIVEGHVEAVDEDAALQAGGTEPGLLGESDQLEGVQFLGVDGLVDGEEVVLETGDLIEFFEPDDGEGGGGEAVSAGVLGGAGLAFGSARAGTLGRVGAVGCELLIGSGHNGDPFDSQIACGLG
jgi:hypothetical protein